MYPSARTEASRAVWQVPVPENFRKKVLESSRVADTLELDAAVRALVTSVRKLSVLLMVAANGFKKVSTQYSIIAEG